MKAFVIAALVAVGCAQDHADEEPPACVLSQFEGLDDAASDALLCGTATDATLQTSTCSTEELAEIEEHRGEHCGDDGHAHSHCEEAPPACIASQMEGLDHDAVDTLLCVEGNLDVSSCDADGNAEVAEQRECHCAEEEPAATTTPAPARASSGKRDAVVTLALVAATAVTLV